MDSALLSPHTSRPNSPRNELALDPLSPDDGYDYNKLDTDPAIRATKPRNLPSSVAAAEAPQEIVATSNYEEQDITYTETLPHIYQRQQGGWNAKVPDLETSKSNALVSHQVTSNPSGQLKRIMLQWTMDRNLEKQTLLIKDAREDGQLEDPDLQRRVFWK